MGLLDLLMGRSANPVAAEAETRDVKGVEVKVLEIGSPGTEIYSGYLSEEYLKELTGREWADKIDMMRRSDANIRMVLNAIKLPLKSSPWTIVPKEKSEAADIQKKLFDKILFEDLNKSFTQLVGEILTCLDFGYSLFDITHNVKDDGSLGGYNGLKSIAYRSQRTIERWNMDAERNLKTVTQIAYGDEGGTYELDARFLLYFSPEREGDNFEGISILRACYGPWFRKNEFLKKLAIGIEKFAVPTAVLTVPEGTEGKPEYAAAKKALACYTSGQTNYLILPQGYTLSFNNVSVDVEKIRSAINAENQEMVNSILASFLLLGQNGAGSLALSGTLSDFFSQTVQYIADHISEQFERKIFKPLCQMNFGSPQVLIELKCDGLEHRANEAWANMVNGFISTGAIKADDDLEINLREKLKLPPKQIQEQQQQPQPGAPQQPTQLAEKKKTVRPEPDLIRATADRIRMAGKAFLPQFSKRYARSIMIQKERANESDAVKAPLKATVPSMAAYRSALAAAYMIAKIEADKIQSKIFKGSAVRLSEFRLNAMKLKRVTDAIDAYESALEAASMAKSAKELEAALSELAAVADRAGIVFADYLTPAQKKAVDARAEIFSDIQKNDILKAIDLQFQNSLLYATTEELEQDLIDAADEEIGGPMTLVGPDAQASQVVNDGLVEAAQKYSEETGDEIISYTYVAKDDDRTTDICRELDGSTFAADDPAVNKFSPPLHFNCRSFLQVNTSRTRDNPEITGVPKLTKAAQGQLQFSEQTFEFAEYHGKQVELDKPFRTPEGPKKFAVYVKNDRDNIVMVRFGDPNMEIKRDDPERRKNFRARHKCDIDPGPKWKARYWSCKFWSDESVGDLLFSELTLGGPGSGCKGENCGRPKGSGETEKDKEKKSASSVASRNAEIKAKAEADIASGKSTAEAWKDSTGKYQFQRKELHDKILNERLSKVESSDKPIAILTGGGSGSGKSSVIESRLGAMKDRFVHVDSDDIKSSIPEYNQMVAKNISTAAAQAHDESSELSGELIRKSIEQRKPLIYDSTMKNVEKFDKLVTNLKNNGYEVHIVFADLPIETAKARAAARALRTGRTVPEQIIEESHRGAINGLKQLYKKADSTTVYSTDGTPPPKLAYSRSGRPPKTKKNLTLYQDMKRRGIAL